MTSSASNVSDGDIDLDVFFRRYSRELNNYAYRRLRDREAAADVVQDGFLRFIVWLRSEHHDPLPQGPRFFLWRVIGNLTIDLLRRQRVLGPLEALDDFTEILADSRPAPDRCLEAKQQLRLLRTALDELPGQQRAALLMSRLEGLSHAEIGIRLGVSASMVSKYIMAALGHCLRRLPDSAR